MEFFNRKEEVLEIILTQKGKELFASGSFKPVYYSFHDTDIIYDNGTDEEQNSIAPRIKETPRVKQNTNIYQNSSNSSNLLKQEQRLYSELGGKTLLDQYKPAWQLNFIKSPLFQYVGNKFNPSVTENYLIKLSSSIDNNNVNQDLIPQFDIQTICQIAIFSDENNTEAYLLKDEPIIVDVSELNSFESYEKQEYEVEVFDVTDGIVTNLSFNKNIDNNVYQYFNVLFDNLADFERRFNVKDIYGELVNKDDSTC